MKLRLKFFTRLGLLYFAVLLSGSTAHSLHKLVYFKTGQNIMFRKNGKQNVVPSESIKKVLLEKLQFGRQLVEGCMNGCLKGGKHYSTTRRQYELTEIEYKLRFIEQYSEGNREILDRVGMLRQGFDKAHGSAAQFLRIMRPKIVELDILVEKLVDKKLETLNLQSVSPKEKPLEHALFKQFDASNPECGTDSLIARKSIWFRIQDCKRTPNSSISYKNSKTGATILWELVARQRDPLSGRFHEVWLDTNSSTIWGDKLEPTNQFSAPLKCLQNEKNYSGSMIPEVKFDLPTLKDFEQAINNGMLNVLPNIDYWFWSSTISPDDQMRSFALRGLNGDIHYHGRNNEASIRCIARNSQLIWKN